MTERMVIAVYEDGSKYACSVSMWRSANEHDPKAMELLAQMEEGRMVRLGGGAQPLADMWIDEIEVPYEGQVRL